MLKKLLLPVAALTAMTFVACNETTAASDEPGSSASIVSDENTPTDDPAKNPGEARSSSSTESVSSSSAKEEVSEPSTIPEGATKASCEIKENTDNVFQMTINVIDSAVIDMSVSNKEVFAYSMNMVLDEKLSEAEVSEVCAEMQQDNEEGYTVSCNGRNIAADFKYEESQTILYAVMVQTLVETCKDIQEKGYLEDDEDDEDDEENEYVPEEKFECDVDLISDHWTISSNSFKGDFTFSGNTMVGKELYTVDLGTEATCLSMIDSYKEISEDYNYTCEGSTLVGELSYTDEEADKKDYYDQLMEKCSSN